MNAQAIISRLEGGAEAVRAWTAGVSAADGAWRPPSGAWSILEIVNHLADEEVDDFRRRLESTLRDPEEAWAAIDPEAWARDRRYNERDLAESAARFALERAKSVAWLKGLCRGAEGAPPDWSRTHRHPKFGPISAGSLLASWAAHDALHLRQIAKRCFELTQRDAAGEPISYAGGTF